VGAIELSEEEDTRRWPLTKSGTFSVQSMYLPLKLSSVKWPHRILWFIRAPLKVNVFLWLTTHNSI
jgi:hypothetical protein